MSRVRVLVPVVLALSLFAAGCGGKDDSGEPEPSAGAPTAAATESSPSASAPAFAGTLIKVTVSGSKVAPRPSTHKIHKGDKVRVEVTSDKNDELHIHGYDKSLELKAGQTGAVEFTADVSGRFEAETHESGLLLFNLEVS